MGYSVFQCILNEDIVYLMCTVYPEIGKQWDTLYPRCISCVFQTFAQIWDIYLSKVSEYSKEYTTIHMYPERWLAGYTQEYT